MRGLLIVCSLALVGCGAQLRRFSSQPIVWADPDQRAFAPIPEEEQYTPYFWDAMDHLLFRPAAEFWLFEPARPAMNVNALDEVPSSSWFANRLGRQPMSPLEVVAGACGLAPYEAPTPWTVRGGKVGGASPGLIIEDANGIRYVLKTDRERQPVTSTAADAIAAAIFHAAGYNVPCNRVVHFDPEELRIGEGATVRRPNDRRRPMTQEYVDRVVAGMFVEPAGHRVMLSRFVEGRPLGPWSFTGIWEPDPNDVVPHEHRRELRGSYLFDAWLEHWDARSENTLATWIDTGGGGGYVRHYLLDFGECMGLVEGNHRRAPRFGNATYLDVGQIVEDVASLGIIHRAWDGRTPDPVLGFFSAEHFDADGWHPQYWNGALDRRTEEDVAWAARILARFSDEHIRALVELGEYPDATVAEELARILIARRDALLERYLTRRSALTAPELTNSRICLTDLALSSGLRAAGDRAYEATLYGGPGLAPRSIEVRSIEALSMEGAATADRVCATLGDMSPSGPDDYAVVDVHADRSVTPPARVHLRPAPGGGWTIVGLERPGAGQPLPGG